MKPAVDEGASLFSPMSLVNAGGGNTINRNLPIKRLTGRAKRGLGPQRGRTNIGQLMAEGLKSNVPKFAPPNA